MNFDVEKIRKDFPIFQTQVNGKPLVYFDSAATSQRPQVVIDSVCDFYAHKNANVSRGLHRLAEDATVAYEDVREKVSHFINARDGEVIFTSGATTATNLVMRGWGEKFIHKGDKIVTTVIEHHSNFVPWQQLATRKGAHFEVVDIDENGKLDLADFEKQTRGAKLVCVCAASNVLGTINDISALASIVHSNGALLFVDGAQSVPSIPTDFSKLGCDFLCFSGHKMLAPFGSGVLCANHDLLEQMDPFIYGSEMIRSVDVAKSQWSDVPHKFESGTPDVSAIIGLGVAIDYLTSLGMENIKKYEESLTKYFLKRLDEIKDVTVFGPKDHRVPLASFSLDGIHSHDIAVILDEAGIAVRSGHHCAMPLHSHLGVMSTTRASLYFYSTKSEIDAFATSLEHVKNVFKSRGTM